MLFTITPSSLLLGGGPARYRVHVNLHGGGDGQQAGATSTRKEGQLGCQTRLCLNRMRCDIKEEEYW